MNTEKTIIRAKLDQKIKRVNFLLKSLILLLFVIIAYDSVIHQTPLYYIGFLILGLIVGRIYAYFYFVEHEETTGQLTLKSDYKAMIISLALILFRLFLAWKILEAFNVIWINDAIYLFFIGVYRSRWKAIETKIDLKLYQIFKRNFIETKEPTDSY